MSDHSSLIAACEHCEQKFPVSWEQRGRVVECPSCFGWVDAPDPASEFQCCEDCPVELPVRGDLGLRFEFADGFPRPVWQGVFDCAPVDAEHCHQHWTDAAAVWLDAIISVLPPTYARHHSKNFALLSALDAEEAERMLSVLERNRLDILKLLDGVATDEGYGPHVVLAFSGHEAYCHYVGWFFPDGEFGGSGGMALTDMGYDHIVIRAARGFWHSIVAHELTHLLLRHLPLPSWLNEGITQMAESVVGGTHLFNPTPDSFGKQRKFWRQHSLQDLWTGAAFFRPDEGQELAYELSEAMVRLLQSHDRNKLKDLLNHAHADDAGDAALRETYGIGTADLAAQVLGPGDWQPQLPSSSASGAP